MLVQTLAPVLAPALGGQLLRFTDWRGVFAAIGVLGLALGVAAALRAGETAPPAAGAGGGAHRAGVIDALRTYRSLLADRGRHNAL